MKLNYLSGWFKSSLATNAGKETSRLKTDSQSTAFAANNQFKLFYRIEDAPHTQQIVFKFKTINPVNIVMCKINLWQGGREYLVYGDDGSHTFTGTLSSVPVLNVNSNLSPDNATHPVSQVTAEVAQGAGIFVAGSPPSNGDAVLTDDNINKSNNQSFADSVQSGVAAGSTFYLVFNHLGQSSVTNGQFFVEWNEIFD